MNQPNILLFMVDQLTSFVLSAYGGKVCKTPNIDELAKRGTIFENVYCNYPLCSPSRASMMTGRLPSRIGAYDNGSELPASIPTFAHYLRNAGYYTCISGKMHFIGPDQFHGFEDRLTTEIYPADMSWTPEPNVPHLPVEDRDHHSQSHYYHYSQDKCSLSDVDYRNARRGYYGMVSNIDAHFGRALKPLLVCWIYFQLF